MPLTDVFLRHREQVETLLSSITIEPSGDKAVDVARAGALLNITGLCLRIDQKLTHIKNLEDEARSVSAVDYKVSLSRRASRVTEELLQLMIASTRPWPALSRSSSPLPYPPSLARHLAA